MGWLVKATFRPHYPQERELVPILQEAGWYQGPVWMVAENDAPTGFDSQTVQTIASGYTNYVIFLLQIYHD
jgi:hypothetical protein